MTLLVPSVMQLSAPRDAISVAADVAGIVIAIAVLVVVAIAGVLFLRINRILGEIRLGVRQNLGPVSDRARSISDNVEFITQVLRSDVEALNTSVRAVTDRLTLASEHMEERIEEFNALMKVVQGEAEDVFLDTAATVRGVRESARSIAGSPRSARRRPESAEDSVSVSLEGDRDGGGSYPEPALAANEERNAQPDEED